MGNQEVPGAVLRAFLFDLDGTLYTDAGAIPGAVEALAELKRRGVPFRFVTNTTRRSRRRLAERLTGYGFAARAEEIITAPQACVEELRARGVRRVAALVADETLEDFGDFDLHSGKPEVVVVGDLGNAWDFAKLNRAFLHLMDGAELIALQHNRYWLRKDGLTLDVGAYAAALEYATRREAVVVGKPSRAFFDAALAELGLETAVMIGDDVEADVGGAMAAGLAGVLVRTGKFLQKALPPEVTPTAIVDSIADVPAMLERIFPR